MFLVNTTANAKGARFGADIATTRVEEVNGIITTSIYIAFTTDANSGHSGTGVAIDSGSGSDSSITQITDAVNGVVFGGRIIFVAATEDDSSGTTDVDVVANSNTISGGSVTGSGGHTLANCGTNAKGLAVDFTIPSGGITNDRIYLANNNGGDDILTSGKLLIQFFGVKTTGI